LNTKKSLSRAKQRLLSAKGAYPFNAQGIMEAEDEVEALENGVERLEGLRIMF
jgi:hypothetical protein